jgi:hypothetical protein
MKSAINNKKDRVSAAKNGESFPSKSLIEAFAHFLEGHPPERFSHNLTSLLLEFMTYDEALELPYLQDLAFDLKGLFELLDLAEKELEN